MIYVLPVYVLVPLIMYIVCVFVMICLLCSPFTSELLNGRGRSKANVEARGLPIKQNYGQIDQKY